MFFLVIPNSNLFFKTLSIGDEDFIINLLLLIMSCGSDNNLSSGFEFSVELLSVIESIEELYS